MTSCRWHLNFCSTPPPSLSLLNHGLILLLIHSNSIHELKQHELKQQSETIFLHMYPLVIHLLLPCVISLSLWQWTKCLPGETCPTPGKSCNNSSIGRHNNNNNCGRHILKRLRDRLPGCGLLFHMYTWGCSCHLALHGYSSFQDHKIKK